MLYEYMKSLGFKDDEIVKILDFNRLSKYNENILYNKIEEIFNYFISLGYHNDDVIKMSVFNPHIYTYSVDTLNCKINVFLELGYSIEEIILMTSKISTLLSRSVDAIREKDAFLKKIGLGKFIVSEPRMLIQSIDLTYARYMFFRKNGVRLNNKNYKILFINAREFFNKFGKNSETLIVLYNYDAYLRRSNKKSKKIDM